MRSLILTSWDWGELLPCLAVATAILVVSFAAASSGTAQDGCSGREGPSSWQVALAVMRRTTIHTFKNPAIIIPSLAFPIVFLLAFAGGLSNVQNVPGFGFAAGYTAFQFVFVFLQMAAFGGIFTGYRSPRTTRAASCGG